MNRISKITLGLALLASVAAHAQNVGINTSNPDASAALDVQSTTQGLLIPRMTKTQRLAVNTVGGVSKPATGLMVYQTDDTPGFYFYNGTAWTTLNSGGQQLANGTAGGQVYLTGATAPYAPQSPVSITGDVTINAAGATSIADASVTIAKIKTTGAAASGSNFLRGDGVWAAPTVAAEANTTVYAARKTTGISLLSLGVFPSGFRAVNFLNAERTVGNPSLYSDTDNTYTIPSTGTYQIGYTFKYGNGLQAALLPNSPGVGIVRTRAGVSTTIDARSFSGANLVIMSLTVSENSLNSIYSFQAGDKISLGLTGSSLLDAGILGTSTASFFIYKVSN